MRKIGFLSNNDKPSEWASALSSEWMESDPDNAAILYIDGHVRVYSGDQTKLPKHYVARQKLCLRATVDYWVNAMDGQPFFLINKEVDPGLLKVLEDEIVPRLEGMVPNQPSQEQQASDSLLHRFTLIFDREGYSPEFFLRMRAERIACLTYHKYPAEKWPEEEFVSHQVKLASGNRGGDEDSRAGHLYGKKGVGTRDSQTNKKRPSNSDTLNRLSLRFDGSCQRLCLPDGLRRTFLNICVNILI